MTSTRTKTQTVNKHFPGNWKQIITRYLANEKIPLIDYSVLPEDLKVHQPIPERVSKKKFC